MHGMVLLHIMRSTLGVALGLFLVIGGAVFTLQWSSMLNNFVSKQLAVIDGSMSYEHWKETPVPMYIDIYFHNWTNPKNIRFEKPRFTQMGPYRFYEKRTKVNLVWNDNGTVSYHQTRRWHFDPENSNGSLSDVVTTVNVVALTSAYISRFKDYFEKKAISYGLFLTNQKIEITKTVEELLFGGYKDDLITMASYIPDTLKNGAKLADKFGWFYKRNDSETHDGYFNMATGESDLGKVGEILNWNYVNQTKFFGGECGAIRGYSGEVFPPGITKSSKPALFSPDLCRPIYLNYQQEEKVYGIPGLKFTGGEQMFDSGALNQENKCYCNGECSAPWGLLNTTACRDGVPIFVSYPHFYNADKVLLDQIEGMEPNEEEHSFQLTLEPTYGFPMELKARFQLNLMIDPLDSFDLYSRIPNRLFMPIFWFDQRAALTSEISVKVWMVLAAPYIGYGFGFILILTGSIMGFIQLLKMSRQKEILAEQMKQVTHL